MKYSKEKVLTEEQNDFSKKGESILILLLLLLLGYIISVRLQLVQDSTLQRESRHEKVWLQPPAVDRIFPDKVANNNWRFDYSKIESILWQSKLADVKVWEIDFDTLTLLENTYKELPRKLSARELQRLQFLMSKNISQDNAEKLVNLLSRYYDYQKHYASRENSIRKNIRIHSIEGLRLEHKAQRGLQEKYFGLEVSRQLFGKRNLTTFYLDNRQFIQKDSDLNSKGKRLKLEKLKRDYTEALKELKGFDD